MKENSTVVLAAHRLIRRIPEGEGPYTGELVTHGDGTAVLRAGDAPDIAWERAGAEHVAAPLDVVRERDGHAVLLPWCTQRLPALVARRVANLEPWTAGECVTAAVSLLRGLDELGDRSGTWWLTSEGRPLVVPGGSSSARDEAGEVLGALAESAADRGMTRLLGEIRDGLAERHPSTARRRRWEDELLAFAAPRALRTDTVAPTTADVVRSLRPVSSQPARRRDRRVRAVRGAALRDVLGAAVQQVRSRLAAIPRPSAPKPSGRGSADERPSRPRGRLLIAGAAAGIVLMVGLTWPQPGEASAEAVTTAVSDTGPDAAPEAESAPEEDAATPASDQGGYGGAEPLGRVSALVDALQRCAASESSCPEAVAQGAHVDPAALVDVDGAEAELIDDYGGTAVIRVGADPQRMLVVVLQNDEWLVRDVLDVADQPDGEE